jgi:hypothetical protein
MQAAQQQQQQQQRAAVCMVGCSRAARMGLSHVLSALMSLLLTMM